MSDSKGGQPEERVVVQYTYEATVRLPNGYTEKVTVQASTGTNAKGLLEAQYGKGAVLIGPVRK